MTGHGKVYEKIEGKKDGETCEGCWFLLKGVCTLSDHPTEVTDYCDGFLPNKELDEQNQSLTSLESGVARVLPRQEKPERALASHDEQEEK